MRGKLRLSRPFFCAPRSAPHAPRNALQAMRFDDVLLTAFRQLRANKLRSFFTLLGIIVSVAFLVAVVAITQGMNAYVKENIADNVVGTNTFQVRRMPARVGLFSEDDWRVVLRRPKITPEDAAVVRQAIPEALAISLTSGYPTPQADVVWGNRTLGDVLIFGITPAYQIVQDYRFSSGQPLSDVDVRERRYIRSEERRVGRGCSAVWWGEPSG